MSHIHTTRTCALDDGCSSDVPEEDGQGQEAEEREGGGAAGGDPAEEDGTGGARGGDVVGGLTGFEEGGVVPVVHLSGNTKGRFGSNVSCYF